MNFEGMKFPLYRKYKNNKSYFKIINPGRFEEIQFIGKRKMIKQTDAVLFPEKLFIKDLVFDYQQMAEEITESEYNAVKETAE
jgi:uncharacterized pyridoxamine 5'-phosphate oxidase family protein